MALQIPFEGMQLPAWYGHILRACGVIQRSELQLQALGMIGPDACLAASEKESL